MQTATHTNPNAPMAQAKRAGGAGRLVTDAPIRVFHGLLALSFLGAYLSAESERWRPLHVALGYTMAGLLLFRLLYGIWGPKQSQWGVLWRKVSNAPGWLRATWQVRTVDALITQWRQGQSLLLSVTIWSALLAIVPLTLSGYATYNDWGDVWGGDLLSEVHEWMGNAFLVLVLSHVAMVVLVSLWRRKNHAALMWSGRLPGPGPDLIRNNRLWLAVLLVVAVGSYLTWEWRTSPQGLVPASVWAQPSVAEHGDD